MHGIVEKIRAGQIRMDITSAALQGLSRAEDKLEDIARKVAKLPATDATLPVDQVDLSAEIVALIQARNEHAVNAKVLETAQEIEKHLLDVLG